MMCIRALRCSGGLGVVRGNCHKGLEELGMIFIKDWEAREDAGVREVFHTGFEELRRFFELGMISIQDSRS